MHRRGKMAAEPASDSGCSGQRRCLRVSAVSFFFFSGSRYALIRANLGRLALNRTNLRWISPYRPKHNIPVPNRLIQAKIQKKKKV